jgi:arabinofuranosyltransferase
LLLVVAPLFIATNTSFAYWAVSGLESVPFALLVLLSIYRYLLELRDRHRIRLCGLVFALCYLMRPDGALFFVAALIHQFLFPRIARSRDEVVTRARAAAPMALPFIAIVAAHLLWRRWYYGMWLPNTFYAKTGGNTEYLRAGLDYVKSYAAIYGGYAAYVLPLLYIVGTGVGSGAGVLLLSLGVYLAYVVAIGGDYMPHFRLLTPVMLLVALLWQEAVRRLWRRQIAPRVQRRAALRRAATGVVAIALLAAGWRVMTMKGVWLFGSGMGPVGQINRGFSARTARRNAALLVRGGPYWMRIERRNRCGLWEVGCARTCAPMQSSRSQRLGAFRITQASGRLTCLVCATATSRMRRQATAAS